MKIIFLIIIILLAPTMLFGQRAGIYVGLGAGNLYTVDKGFSGPLPKYQYSFSYSVDVNWWSKISNRVFLSPGIGIASTYTTYENTLDLRGQEKERERLNLLYLKLPTRIYFVINKFMPHIGPSFGYLIHDKVKEKGENYVYTQHFFNNKFDYGIDIGLGIKFSSTMYAGLSFYNGFGNLGKIECGNCVTSKAETSKFRSFELYLNYIMIK